MAGGWPRIIIHADMDAFYAAVEQLDNPALRNRPVIVGHDSDRGVVLTASYEARVDGVGSAMPMARARRQCPEAIIVAPRFTRYQEISATIMRVFAQFSPRVEALSLDEAFLDVTGMESLFGAPYALALELKREISRVTGGLTASVGISATKFVAKLASGYRKPDGLTMVAPEQVREWLAPQPVSRLWGVGPKSEGRLRALGISRVGDLATFHPERLEAAMGRAGRQLWALSQGMDPRSVRSDRRTRSIGSERTFARDIRSRPQLGLELRQAADNVARRLRRKGYVAAGVRIKLKTHEFRIVTRQCQLSAPTDLGAHLHEAALKLLAAIDERGPFRLAGLSAYGLIEASAHPQRALGFASDAKMQRLETALDRLRERFGADSIRRGATDLGVEGVGAVAGPNLDFIDDEPLGD
jgi:DNA polymerase IV